MAEVKLPGHIIEALKVFSSGCGFKEPKLEYSEGSDKGYIGLIKRCRVSEGERSLSVICKFLPDNQELNAKYESYELFRREVFVYQKFLPQLEKIQLEHGFNYRDNVGFWSFSKCYHSKFDEECPEESFILMEDLAEEKFMMRDTNTPFNFEHTHKLFVELGKFHAISFVIKEKRPEIFEEFKHLNDLMCKLMTTENMKDFAPRNCKLASELFSSPEENLQKEKILSYVNDLWEQNKKVLEGSNSEPFAVVCHGDCWINNIMCNYFDEDQKEIKNVCLIDWQMTRFGSGASELMYFLFCCTNKQLRDQHKNELFDAYYNSLAETLKIFDMDVKEIYPQEKFEEQLKTFGKFAFAMATFAMPIFCKYPEKLFEDKNAELTEDEKKAVTLYEQRMKNVVNDLIEMNAL